MNQPLPPPRPGHLPESPEFPRESRYRRRRALISWWALGIGLVLGLGVGLFYAWQIAPVIETDTAPVQLSADRKADYAVAAALSYSYNSDLQLAVDRLLSLNLGLDPIAEVANIACDLARSGYVDSSAGLRGVRSLMTFYQLQGRTSCADALIAPVDEPRVVEIAVPTPTPTLPPPPSKTPTPASGSAMATPTGVRVVPTTPPQRRFSGSVVGTLCDPAISGVIEVRVQTFNGQPIPGETVRVRWNGGESRFASGLKPERGADYADFQMQPGFSYTVDMPGQSDPVSGELTAETCISEGGTEALTTYYVVFRQVG